MWPLLIPFIRAVCRGVLEEGPDILRKYLALWDSDTSHQGKGSVT